VSAPAARHVAPSLAVAACVAAALTGCGTGTLRTKQIESTITKQFRAQGIAVSDVACEDGTKGEKGARIACTARNPSGTTLVIEGHVTSTDDDRATFEAKAVRGVARGTAVADEARGILEAKIGRKAAGMACPAKVPIPTRPTVRCVLRTAEGPRYAATVRIDAQSRVQVQLADSPLPER
jgi:hypothetical protein